MTDTEPDKASQVTLRLATLTYTARQVTDATGISADMLTNYLAKAKITLCSHSPGQGRSRAFCYVDVLQLKLLASLVDLTGAADWSARALEYVLFQEVSEADLRSIASQMASDISAGAELTTYETGRTPEERVEQINHLREQFCADVTKSPAIYWARSLAWKHWLLFADRFDIECGQFKLTAFRSDRNADAIAAFSRSGYLLNATAVLQDVDRELDRLIRPEESE